MGILERARSILRTETQALLAQARDGEAALRGLIDDLEEDILEVEDAAVRFSREAEALQEDARGAEAASLTALDDAQDALRDDDEATARTRVEKHLAAKRRARKLGDRAAERRRYARELQLLVEPLGRKLDEVRTRARSQAPPPSLEEDDEADWVGSILEKLRQELHEDPDTAPGLPTGPKSSNRR